MFTLKNWAAAAAMVAVAGSAQAALVTLGDGTVKDDVTNLIWLQNWNVNGAQTLATQKAWAENLNFAGSTDWVLPSISDYTTLFGEVGDLTQVSQFTNVQSRSYWSSTEVTPDAIAWIFFPLSGFAGLGSGQFFSVAVRPGDVTAAVPEPQSLALVLLGLGATVVARRWRARQGL